MASHTAIAAVSRTIRTLLLDRMVTGAEITLAPPDVEVGGVSGARVNLYLMQVIENASLKNQEIPGRGTPGAYGHPPLSLDLRYLMTTHSAIENQRDADINAQTLLGDAMRVMNDFGNRIDQLVIVNPVAGAPGDPILDPDLTREFERLKIVLHPATLDDITKVWSAVSGTNFRRSVVYEVTVVQIGTPAPRVRPAPVETRRILVTTRRRPEITDAYVSPAAPGDPIGEMRARIGDEITIVAQHTLVDRLYVRFGTLEPMRVSPPGDGRVRIVLPDAQYAADLDHPMPRPIPIAEQLQPGTLEIQLIAMHPAEGVEGGLGRGTAVTGSRRYASNVLLLQLCPEVTGATPAGGNAATILRVTGNRLWQPNAGSVDVIIGDAAIPVRVPGVGDPWAPPTPLAIEVPVAAAGTLLDISAVPYRVAVQVDGACSRNSGIKDAKQPDTGAELSWHAQNLGVMAAALAWIGSAIAEPGAGASSASSDAYQAARGKMRELGAPAAIDRLSALFRLSPFDEDVLLLALSSQRQARPKTLTPQLIHTTLCAAAPEAEAKLWERLSPHAPLRRFQLIECAERPLAAATTLVIDERIARFLMGEDSLDTRIANVLVPVAGGPLPKCHLTGIAKLAERIKAGASAHALIIGPKHSGRRAAATTLARGFGLAIAEIRAPTSETTPDLIPILAREAALGGFAVLVDLDQAEAKPLLETRLGQFDGLVIAIAKARHELTFEPPLLRLDPLEVEDRVQIWHDALGPDAAETYGAIASVAAQFKFGPRGILAAATEGGDLWQACRERASRELDELADRIIPRYGWDDVVLPSEIVHDLKAAAAQVRHSALVYGTHGFARKHARGRGISVLLAGPSGTGKTMAAEIVANDLKLDLYRIDLSRVVSKYIGETEKNLRAVFDAAEVSGAVLLFDEADALFGKRSEVNDSHDRYANIEVSYLLQRMESYSGLAILATNMKCHLDAAFMRRLRYVIDVPFPDAAARRQIWQKAFPPELPCAALDFDALARLDIPGGNIAVIAINAAFLAASDGAPLEMRHIAAAARAEYRKIDRELRMSWLGLN